MNEREQPEPSELAFFTTFGGEDVCLTRENTRVIIIDDCPEMSCVIHQAEGTLNFGFGHDVVETNIPLLERFGFTTYHSSELEPCVGDTIREYFWRFIRTEIDRETAAL